MKRRAILFLLCAVLLLSLVSCGPEVISLVPVYKGEAVTDTHHEFTQDDFDVYLTYDDGTQSLAGDFEIEVKGMNAGYYILDITAEGFTEEAYVPINIAIYPSDSADQNE